MTQKGNAKAAYEGILVVSQQPTTIINETTRNIINQEIKQNTRVVIEDDDEDDDDDDECPRGWVRIGDECWPPICLFDWCGWHPIYDPGQCPPGTTGTPPDCIPIEDPICEENPDLPT
jgi:hypothetical protein